MQINEKKIYAWLIELITILLVLKHMNTIVVVKTELFMISYFYSQLCPGVSTSTDLFPSNQHVLKLNVLPKWNGVSVWRVFLELC